jgi:hypothetical protein
LSWFGTMTIAIQHTYAKHMLEVSDHLRDYRLGDGKPFGGSCHAAALRDRKQNMEVPQPDAAPDAIGPVHSPSHR